MVLQHHFYNFSAIKQRYFDNQFLSTKRNTNLKTVKYDVNFIFSFSVSCKEGFLLFNILDFSGIVTRRPLVLQLQKTEQGLQEYAEFLHLPKKRFTDFCMSFVVQMMRCDYTI
jgi:hypothetical protein